MEKQLRVLADVLSKETDLLFPCAELTHEWCFEHCEGESYPDAECWLKYAEEGSEGGRKMTCTDCIHKNRCMERSRNYACTDFRWKGEKE